VVGVKETTGEFKVTGMDEQTYADRDPGKLTRASGPQEFAGGIEGIGRVEWLMCYRDDGTADYVGMQEIDGTIDGRKGGFVVTAVGTFDGQRSEGRWEVVPGSGKGDLAGIVGDGGFKAGPGPQATFQLRYDFG
jgi:Protein of unknown function (DUF3224)